MLRRRYIGCGAAFTTCFSEAVAGAPEGYPGPARLVNNLWVRRDDGFPVRVRHFPPRGVQQPSHRYPTIPDNRIALATFVRVRHRPRTPTSGASKWASDCIDHRVPMTSEDRAIASVGCSLRGDGL